MKKICILFACLIAFTVAACIIISTPSDILYLLNWGEYIDIDDDTDEGTLHLDTNDGVMEIRLDSNTNFSKCPVLLLNKSVTVVAQRGSDAYYHAVTITSNY